MADAILRSPELLPLVTVFQDGVWEMMHQELQAWQLLFRETDRSRLWESLMRVPVYRLRSLSDPRYVLHHALVTKQSIDHVRRMMQRYPDRISPEFFALASEHLTLGQFREVYKEALTLGSVDFHQELREIDESISLIGGVVEDSMFSHSGKTQDKYIMLVWE
ncbi:unnamed protein product [Aphanomyces euteiches]